MQFVLSAFPKLPQALFCYPRLYSFPRKPDPAGDTFVLLDSGAYGLSRRGVVMGKTWQRRLAEHYSTYCSERVLGIAPDVYLDPKQSVQNFRNWHRGGTNPPVIPVLHSTRAKYYDLYSMAQQVAFYATQPLPRLYGRPVIAIGNPNLRASECRAVLPHLRRIILGALPDAWIHVLGAGWDVEDITLWRKSGCADSIDSIAYYEDAKAGSIWSPIQMPLDALTGWRAIAAHNATLAVKLAKDEV